jgi:hypothetical protein
MLLLNSEHGEENPMTSKEKKSVGPGGENLSGDKRVYESPKIVPLGEVAKGSARCQTGTFPADECTAGTLPIFVCGVGTGAA